MSEKPESGIVDKIIEWIEAHDGNAFKLHGSVVQRGGEADIIGAMPVVIHRVDSKAESVLYISLALEVKQPGKEATARQLYRLAKWSTNNWCAGVVDSVEDVEKLISRFVSDILNGKRNVPNIDPRWFAIGIMKK